MANNQQKLDSSNKSIFYNSGMEPSFVISENFAIFFPHLVRFFHIH